MMNYNTQFASTYGNSAYQQLGDATVTNSTESNSQTYTSPTSNTGYDTTMIIAMSGAIIITALIATIAKATKKPQDTENTKSSRK
ncbi:hypothetical protein KC867_02365 [Candidatus Saccharibacteria bacterium]|nr:hypothetical protein [Candidatus Saccharibacteria bacterium]